MPIPSPFHARTAALSESQEWRSWSGYLAAGTYSYSHEYEYFAIRNAAALIDVSPLFKYELLGPGAPALVDRIFTRDLGRCKVGQVMYTPWCDDDGYVIDDGTVQRLGPDHFLVTAAEPNLAWFQDCAWGLPVEIRDVSDALAALAVQGPNARRVLADALDQPALQDLKYYCLAHGRLDEIPVMISRTGYTGDLGYEVWLPAEHAPRLWDRLMGVGAAYGLAPAGIIALDIARIEAGLLMAGVDYFSVRKALNDNQKSTPYDLGLDWAVDLRKERFVGRAALARWQRDGTRWQFTGLEVDWPSLEALYQAADLAPQLAGRASRLAVPIFRYGRQVGQATSHTFSPILKKYIAIGTVERAEAGRDEPYELEFTVEYARQRALAYRTAFPFFNPPRKRK